MAFFHTMILSILKNLFFPNYEIPILEFFFQIMKSPIQKNCFFQTMNINFLYRKNVIIIFFILQLRAFTSLITQSFCFISRLCATWLLMLFSLINIKINQFWLKSIPRILFFIFHCDFGYFLNNFNKLSLFMYNHINIYYNFM